MVEFLIRHLALVVIGLLMAFVFLVYFIDSNNVKSQTLTLVGAMLATAAGVLLGVNMAGKQAELQERAKIISLLQAAQIELQHALRSYESSWYALES